jgi:hypothetical protein
MFGQPLSERKKAMQNAIAERALKRGRKLTANEQIANLEAGLDMQSGELLEKFKLKS